MEKGYILIFCVIEVVNYIIGYKILYNPKFTKKVWKYVVYFVLFLVIGLLIVNTGGIEVYSLFCIICGGMIPFVLIEENKLKNFVLLPSVVMVVSIISTVIMYLYSYVGVVEYYQCRNNIVVNCIINVTVTISISIVEVYINAFRDKKAERLNFGKLHTFIFTLGLLCVISIISLLQYIYDNRRITMKTLSLLGLAVSLGCFIFIIISLWLATSVKKYSKLKYEKKLTELYMAKQEEYIRLIESKNESIRCFKHDVHGHMIVLGELLKEKKYEDAKNYMYKMDEGIQKKEVGKYTYIATVDAIITELHEIMIKKNIHFTWKGSISNATERIEIFDLCTIFMNILSNAVEACERLGDGGEIEVICKMFNGKVLIIERNSILMQVEFDTEGNPITTKDNSINHGIGCKNIRTAVNKYDGLLKYSCYNDVFEVQIMI